MTKKIYVILNFDDLPEDTSVRNLAVSLEKRINDAVALSLTDVLDNPRLVDYSVRLNQQ